MRNEVALPASESPVSRWVLTSLAVVLVVETVLFVTYGRFNMDEGIYLNTGRLLFEYGMWPYRDYPFSQGPGAPLLYGLTDALFGNSLLLGRILSAAMSLTVVAAMAWFAHRMQNWVAAALVLLLVIVTFPAMWVFSQTRTETPAIFLAVLATIAWFQRKGGAAEFRAGQVARWALAPSLLVWATAFRLTYVFPLAVVCLLTFWELRRSPRTLGWTVGIIGINGLAAALPMLVFWEDTFFHIIESQWGRAERLGLDELPPSARFWFFRQPGTGFRAILFLSAFPLFEIVRNARRGWRPAVGHESATPLTFVIVMAALTYLPLLTFKLGFHQYFVNASLLLILAIGISIPSVARLSKGAGIFVSVAFAIAWGASASDSLAHLERWVSTDAPTIAKLAPVRREVEALTPDGCTMLTLETHIALEAGCDVTAGLEYSYFSYFPDMSDSHAREHGVLNRKLLLEGLRGDPPEYVALTREGAKQITGREFDRNEPPILRQMQGRYRLLQTLRLPIGPVYRFWDEVYLYARMDLQP